MLHAQLCPTFCVPVDCSLPGSSVRAISQATILEWLLQGIFPTLGPKLHLPMFPALQADSLRLSNGGPESVVSLFSVSFLNNHAHLHISFWHLDMDLCIQVTSFSRTEEHVKTLSPSCIIAYTLCSTTGLHIIS